MAERYKKDHPIQEGTYGVVWMCIDSTNGQQVAMKQSAKDETADHEIYILNKLQHPNIIKIIDSFSEPFFNYVIYEYGGTDLQNIYISKQLDLDTIRSYMFQLLTGLDYMHNKGYVHRDIKPSNLLINSNGELKIADFGVCTMIEEINSAEMPGTYQYAPLDYLLGFHELNEKYDIWSAGCVFAELLKGEVIFDGDGQLSIIMKIIKTIGTPQLNEWPETDKIDYFQDYSLPIHPSKVHEIFANIDEMAIDLLMKMLCCSQLNRISAKEALLHPFFVQNA